VTKVRLYNTKLTLKSRLLEEHMKSSVSKLIYRQWSRGPTWLVSVASA